MILLFVAGQRKTTVSYLKRRNQFGPVQNSAIDSAVSLETTMKSISFNNGVYFAAFTLLATYVIPRIPLPINEEISCGISSILFLYLFFLLNSDSSSCFFGFPCLSI